MGLENMGFSTLPQPPVTLEDKKHEALPKIEGYEEEIENLREIFATADPKRFECGGCEKELNEPSFYDLTDYKAEEHRDGTIILHPKTARVRFTLVWLQGAGNHCYRAKVPFMHADSPFPRNVKIIIPTPPKKVKDYLTAPNFWVDAEFKDGYQYLWKEDPLET
jgi:hypothetical protein